MTMTRYRRIPTVKRLGLLLAVVSLSLVAAHGAGAAPVLKGDLTISADDNPILYGRSAGISGRLKNTTLKAAIPVTLQEKPYPYTGGYKDVDTQTTSSTGSYSFDAVSPLEDTRYRVVTAPPKAVSPELLLKVRIKVVLRLGDRTPRRGQRVRFHGTAASEHDGRTVYIQRRSSTGSWRTVKTAILQDAGTELSTFSTRIQVRRNGTYRARVFHDANHEDGTSRHKRARVH
jgi:hypothetical protein